jgi:3-oxoadipate enol-lactonase
MAFVRIGNAVLHAQRWGDPARPALVFSNSLGTDHRIWSALVEPMLDAYSLLLYDKRGHGLSELSPDPLTIEDHAEDLIGLADHFGIGRFALVGLSVGGMIGQVVAARHGARVAALVLCDTAAKIGTVESWTARIEAVRSVGLASIADVIMERWFTGAYRHTAPDALRGWRTMLARQPADGYVATCVALRDADLTALAATIAVPTLCVAGDQDLSTPPDVVRGTAGLIGGARFEIIEAAGHLPCIEQPMRLRQLILHHLAEAGHV